MLREGGIEERLTGEGTMAVVAIMTGFGEDDDAMNFGWGRMKLIEGNTSLKPRTHHVVGGLGRRSPGFA